MTQNKPLKFVILSVFLFFSGCAATVSQSSVQNLNQQEIKSETEVQKKQRINAEYEVFLKTNVCDSKDWTRYEFGSYFVGIALKYKITPYDIALGDSYTKRNIPRALLKEASDNYFRYVNNYLPYPASEKYFQVFPLEEMQAHQQKIFNTLMLRDYECYVKLK